MPGHSHQTTRRYEACVADALKEQVAPSYGPGFKANILPHPRGSVTVSFRGALEPLAYMTCAACSRAAGVCPLTCQTPLLNDARSLHHQETLALPSLLGHSHIRGASTPELVKSATSSATCQQPKVTADGITTQLTPQSCIPGFKKASTCCQAPCLAQQAARPLAQRQQRCLTYRLPPTVHRPSLIPPEPPDCTVPGCVRGTRAS